MSHPLQLQTFTIGSQTIFLFVPELSALQKGYEQDKNKNPQTPFPYWAQVWPAAKALGVFLIEHTHFIQDKKLLELAAGLGLPSLLAAPYASHVTCSDLMEEAAQVAQKSAQYNGLFNLQCTTLDWHHLPNDLFADVVMLSDVNYSPPQFEMLYQIIQQFIESGTTVIISTPQRLMAKDFINRLLPWCTLQQNIEVEQDEKTVPITVMVLQKSGSH